MSASASAANQAALGLAQAKAQAIEGWSFHSITNAIRNAAEKALDFLSVIGTDWAAIKADPAYGLLASLAEKAALAELTAQGVPIGPLVNVGQAVEATLDALAAAHPAISTAPAP